MGLTTDPIEARNSGIREDGQQNLYVILSDEERAKGFVRPVRASYKHLKCGTTTTMGYAIAETYARNPHFYGGTFCCWCKKHFYLRDYTGNQFFMGWQFLWPDGEPVGSDAEEAQEYLKAVADARNALNVGAGI